MNPQALTTRIAQAAALVAVAATVGVTLATPAHAQEATEIFSHSAMPVLLNDKVYLYGLPTRTADGKVRYWDVVVDMDANGKGKPKMVSFQSVEREDGIKKAGFVPGSYVNPTTGYNCTLSLSPFNGRHEGRMNCFFDTGAVAYTAVWYTGPIAGHPWEAEFVAAGLDTLSGADEFAWGKVIEDRHNSCLDLGNLFSARQVGDQVSIVNYVNDAVPDCDATHLKSVD